MTLTSAMTPTPTLTATTTTTTSTLSVSSKGNGWRRLRRLGWCVITPQFVLANLIILSLLVWSSLDLVSSPDGGARSSPPLTVAELDGIDPAFLVALEGLPQSPRPDVTSDDA